MSETSKGSKLCPEEYYVAEHLIEVSKVVADSLAKYTGDCSSLDKVTDATDEVGVC